MQIPAHTAAAAVGRGGGTRNPAVRLVSQLSRDTRLEAVFRCVLAPQGAQRGRKSRRTQLDQGAGGGGRVDGDGDVDMHGGDEGPSGGGDDDVDMERRRGRRGGRRRKQRNADGTYSVMDVDEDGGGGGGREEGGGEGGHGQPPHHEEEHHHEQESFDPLVGRMGAGQVRRSGALTCVRALLCHH